jgi:carboxymethylenebutenolidase
MGHWIELDTPPGSVRTWRADTHTDASPALVLVQEIFGVNDHIREVADRLAAAGFTVLAPSMADPVEPGVELAYDAAGVARGRRLVAALGFDRAVDIVSAAASALRSEGRAVGIVGFCWGGTIAFLGNTRVGLPAVSYYGGRTVPFLGEALRAPMMFHFGRRDSIIPPRDVEAHRHSQPDAVVHVYAAGHGFNCDPRADFDAEAAALAWERTVAFFREQLS